jgi:hypothetical protein
MPDFGIFRGFNEKLFGDKLYAGQLPINLGLIGSDDFGIDPDAQSFFDRVTAAGGTLSTTEQLAINTLVIQMKDDGIWTKMKAIYPMVGASAAACAQNLKSSSFTGSFTSGWTFASTGATPNGTSAYMDMNLIPNNVLSSANSTHISYYSRTLTSTNGGIEIGVWNDGFLNGIQFGVNRSGVGTYVILNTASATQLVVEPTQDSTGFFYASRTADNLLKYFKNNSLVGTDNISRITGLSINNVFLAAGNDFGTATKFSNKECAFASIGDGLTDDEADDYYTAVQAFQTTLSRQV